MSKIFGKKLKLALEQRGISQQELMRRTELSDGAISRYVNGSRVPTVENVMTIAKALGISYEEIIMWFEDSTPNLKRETLKERYIALFEQLTDFEAEVWVNGLERMKAQTDDMRAKKVGSKKKPQVGKKNIK